MPAEARFDDCPTLLVTLLGEDRPGLTAAIFGALARPGVSVLDTEQVVVRGRLTLAVLLRLDSGIRREDVALLRRAIAVTAADLELSWTATEGRGDTPRRPGHRLHVCLLADVLQPVAVAAVTARLSATRANIDRVRRLSNGPVTALEFDVSGVPDVAMLRRELTVTAADHRVDVAVSPAGLARHGRRLVVMDVDSTLIQDEVIELLAAHAGRQQEVAAVTERAMRGELDFAESLHARVATLAGLPAEVCDDVRAALRLTPGADTLVHTLHRLGFAVALVSGGFAEVVEPLAATLGIERVRANRLEVADGRLTGRVVGELVDRPAKARALRDLATAEGLPLSRTVAIGDGANDLDMLTVAGLGVAFNAKPAVRERADAALTQPYLDAVLHLLGLTREEIEDALAE